MTAKTLQGKKALITGGGTGIGAAIARRFVEVGAAVLITGRRREPLQRLSEEIGCHFCICDVADFAQCQTAVNSAIECLGGLDILVANAGVLFEGSVMEQDLAQWQSSLDINVTGVMNMARAVLPAMEQNRAGAIVNVASVAAMASGPGVSSYVTSKTAVLGLTRSLAVDYGPMGIRVNSLCPGWVRTPMSDEEMKVLARKRGISVEEATREVTRFLPLGRMAEVEEIADCAEFLASERSSFVTGTTLLADGGGQAVDVGTLAFEAQL
jgi:NAD(P)-dependent dehydrogenase (short-subunit alcohol dehydrogenase family)